MAKYRPENGVKINSMRYYTIEKDEKDTLNLRYSDGSMGKLSDILIPGKRVYAFHACMGAGKTTSITQLCKELGTEDVVNSPTFAIVNVYDIANHQQVYHFDCYRLKDIREAIDFGAEEYLYSGQYCFIEWPDIMEPLLPEDTVHIYIEVQEDGSRRLGIEE